MLNKLHFLLLLAFIVGINSECCRPDPPSQCHDGTTAGPFGCCAYGPCNIICCNCDGGCRGGLDFKNYHRMPRASNAQIIFKGLDKNNDGKLSFDELSDKFGALHDMKIEFPRLDINNDGFVTIDEMDADEK